MKKIIEFVVYIFYRYYDKGSTQSIAYPSALMSTSLLIYINLSTLLIALGVDYNRISPVIESYGRGIRFLSAFLLWLPFFFLLKMFLRKKDIVKKSYTNQVVRIGNISLLLYIIFSMLILIFLIK
jgi:hypothetical protein